MTVNTMKNIYFNKTNDSPKITKIREKLNQVLELDLIFAF